MNLSFPYSNAGYTQLFKGENQECLFQGLKDIFEHIGGVPHKLWFDNASTIVKLLKNGERKLTDAFLRFKQHHGFEAVTVKTNAYAKFSLNGGKHTYSTAPKYAKSRVLVKITVHEVIPLNESHREIVRHLRLYGDYKQESMDWLPYLAQLSRCPGALKYSGIYSMLPDPLREYLDGCSKSERGKALKALAVLCAKSSFEQAVNAVAEALLYGVLDLDSLVAIHNRITNITPPLEPVKIPEGVPELTAFRFNAVDYDKAFLKGGVNVC